MKEQEVRQQVPLFDSFPEGINPTKILTRFDGSLKDKGITMFLNPLSGKVVRAELVNMEEEFEDIRGRKLMVYEPLTRGKWSAIRSDLKDLVPGSYEYEKLDAVYEDVYQKYLEWKQKDTDRFPLLAREWSLWKLSILTKAFRSEQTSSKMQQETVFKETKEEEEVEEKLKKERAPVRRVRKPSKPRTTTRKPPFLKESKPEPRFRGRGRTPARVREHSEEVTRSILSEDSEVGEFLRRVPAKD